MLDDRVCPACRVLLPAGTRICVKCGRTVEPAKTRLAFIDLTRKLYPRLVHHLGPVWGVVAAVAVLLVLLALFLGLILMKFARAR